MSPKHFFNVVTILALFATGCSTTPSAPTAASPGASTQADAWNNAPGKLVAKYHATGVQIYTLTAGADGKFIWKFNAPQATLLDDAGKLVASHYAGPTWESIEGSKIVGAKLRERPSPNPASIPELQLSAKSREGAGIFSTVIFIERLNTTGGVAPTVPDNAKEGREARVPYTADYAFYTTP